MGFLRVLSRGVTKGRVVSARHDHRNEQRPDSFEPGVVGKSEVDVFET